MRAATLRRLVRVTVLPVLVASAHLAFAAPAPGPAEKLGDLSSVLAELRKGGLVIYFRHAATDQDGATDESADLSRCETQRNLSAEGRRQAAQIGKAFVALGIPVGAVKSSPFCRCKETAQLAFHRFTVNKDLYFAVGTQQDETARFARSLRRLLATPPAPGTNAVIVAHTANLLEAVGIWPMPEGVAYVFRPWLGDGFEAVAMIMPDEWDRVARMNSSGRVGLGRGR